MVPEGIWKGGIIAHLRHHSAVGGKLKQPERFFGLDPLGPNFEGSALQQSLLAASRFCPAQTSPWFYLRALLTRIECKREKAMHLTKAFKIGDLQAVEIPAELASP